MNVKLINLGVALALSAYSLNVAAAKDDLPNGEPFKNIQAQVDATNAAIEAANQARTAAIEALEAADAALQARDELLQGQINQINLTLAEEVARINTEIAALEKQIGDVAAGSEQADALQDQIIQRMSDAINTLSRRADAAEVTNGLQEAQIELLWARAQSIETNTNAQFVEARAKFLELEAALTDALARANSAYSLGGQAMARANAAYALADDDVSYDSLLTQLNSVKSTLATLDNHLGAICDNGYYVIGINANGSLKCRTLTDTVSITQSLVEYSYCLEDTFLGCIDYAYYQRGSAYCPVGYFRTATSTTRPIGNDFYLNNGYLNNYTSSATYRTNTYDSSFSSTGSVTVFCTKTYYEYNKWN